LGIAASYPVRNALTLPTGKTTSKLKRKSL
jgi:hypothetical protein